MQVNRKDQITMTKKLSVFIGPLEVAGIAYNLATGFKEQGVNAQLVTKTKHRFNYSSDTTGKLVQFWQFLFHKKMTSKKLLLRVIFSIFEVLYSNLVFVWALLRFNSFIYFGAQTITNTSLELKILKTLSKKIIFVYTGSDVRPMFMNGAYIAKFKGTKLDKLVKKTREQKKKLCMQEKYADYVVNAPGTSQFQAKPFIDWFVLGIPTKLRHQKETDKSSYPKQITILHCPSNPVLKGSNQIFETVNRLKEQGNDINYVELSNVSNSVVLEQISKADIVIDQLYSDTPMAIFASEAASMGAPVIVSGYFAEHVGLYIRKENRPPTSFVTPDNFEEALTELVKNKELRSRLSEESINFIRNNWNRAEVAKRYIQLLTDEVPDSWWIMPTDIIYVNGCGASKQQLTQLWAEIKDKFGEQAFCLDDRPDLLKAVVSQSTNFE